MARIDLIGAARGGDEAAFESLIDPLLDPGYRLALAMLGDREAAEDAVQEAALSAWKAIGRLRADTPDIRPWFLTIVANRCRSVRRGPWWRVLRFGDREPLQARRSLSPEDEATANADLRAALARLGHDQRLVLALRYYMDLPVEEVARVLGITHTAARSRIHRAVESLRPVFEAEAGRSL